MYDERDIERADVGRVTNRLRYQRRKSIYRNNWEKKNAAVYLFYELNGSNMRAFERRIAGCGCGRCKRPDVVDVG